MINDLLDSILNKTNNFADGNSILFSHSPKTEMTDEINDYLARLQPGLQLIIRSGSFGNQIYDYVVFEGHYYYLSLLLIPRPKPNEQCIERVVSHKYSGV